MTDAASNEKLRVLDGGSAGPYLRVLFSQLDELRRLFDSHGVRYWVGENFLSWNGGPQKGIITFGRAGDAAAIQAVLDSIPCPAICELEDHTMTNAATNEKLKVLDGGTAGPCMRVLVSQLDEIRRLLDSHGVRYWVDENYLSWNGGPAQTIVAFGRAGDATAVQAILDNAR